MCHNLLTATVLLGLALTAASCASDNPPAPPPAATPVAKKTVTLGAGGPGAGVRVTYSCLQGDNVQVCGPDAVEGGVWTRKITVPVGTVVRVQVAGGVLAPECWISDESDRMTLSGGAGKHMSNCETTVN